MRQRTLYLAMMALLAMAGPSVAQGGGSTTAPASSHEGNNTSSPEPYPSNDTCPRDCSDSETLPEGARSCRGDFIEQPERQRCLKAYCAKNPTECQRFCKEHPSATLCPIGFNGQLRHIAFDPTTDSRGLANLTLNGHLLLASLRIEGGGDVLLTHKEGRIVMRAQESSLVIHDEANGFIRFEGNATVVLVFPAGVTSEPIKDGARIHYPGGGRAILNTRSLTWLDDRTASLSEFFSFHAVPGSFTAGPRASQAQAKVHDAVERGGLVGAEIRVNKPACDGTADDHCSEVFAYDRVNVDVRQPASVPTATDPIRIVLSANLTEGRTFVVQINRTVLDVDEGLLQLRYFDLPDGENGTTKTEIIFRRASSMQDILDPNDDGGQPEYWVVRDDDGLQVLVSVPHWSVHLVEISSLTQRIPPGILTGVVAATGGIALAAVALFMPRRRRE